MKRIYPALFVLLLLLVSWYYNYDEILPKRPQSVHHWRQCEGASIALNYYQHGMHFFKPEVFYQISDGGTSGYTVGECPILYYAVAVLWKIFGPSDLVFRTFNLLIFFMGLFALFRMLQRILRDNFWAMTIPLLFFSSPMIAFYAANYLTETTALGLTLIGWNLISRYYLDDHRPSFYLAVLVLTVAALLKIVALISVFVIFGIFLLETFKFRDISKTGKFRLDRFKTLSFLLLFGTVAGWYLFARSYNRMHNAFWYEGSSYFLTSTFPIWELEARTIRDVMKEIKEHWLPDYFSISLFAVYGISTAFLLASIRRLDRFWASAYLLLLCGTAGFFLLWYYLFAIHDYYAINPMLLLLFGLIFFFLGLKQREQKWFNSRILKAAFALFLIYNIDYARIRLNERYTGWENEYPDYKELHTITPYLRQIGIKQEDKVICFPDGSTNYSLYLMNQPGWTNLNFFDDSMQVKKFIGLGARYLILSSKESISKPCLQPFIKDKAGEYGRVTIFRLHPEQGDINAKFKPEKTSIQ